MTANTATSEVWKPVVGWYGSGYEVSSLGGVRRIDTGKILVGGWGVNRSRTYKTVVLSLDGKQKTFSVHELVCRTFHGEKPSAAHEVRHKNGDRSDNRTENLEWATHAKNMKDNRWDHHGAAAFGERNNKAKLTEDQVVEIRRLWASGNYTQIEIADLFCIRNTQVSHIVRGKQWQHLDGAVASTRKTRRHFTKEEVQQIRDLLAAGVKGTEIATRFQTTNAAVSRIKLGQTWSNS